MTEGGHHEGASLNDPERKAREITETGVDADYRIAFLPYAIACRKYGRGFLGRLPEPHHVALYEERFSPEKYDNAISDANRETVAALDAIADELNAMMENPEILEPARFLELCEEADAIILGKETKKAA